MKESDEYFLKEIVRIVGKRIKEINASISSYSDCLKKTDEYDLLIKNIRANNTCFASSDFKNRILSALSSVEITDKAFFDKTIKNLNYVCTLAEFMENGLFSQYKDSELTLIEEIIKAIETVKNLSLTENDSYRQIVNKKTTELTLCESLYDKLRKGDEGLYHFQAQELTYLLNILADKDFNYRCRVLNLIRDMEAKIHENTIAFLNTNIESMDEEQEQIEEIDEELIISLFNKYGFDFSIFTEKQKTILRTRCDLSRIEEVLSVLSTYPEYAFVKQYGKSRNINEKIRGKNIRKLFFVIRFASKETLEYIINDAVKRGVSVETIFGVNGVYKKVSKPTESNSTGGGSTDEDNISGSYEYYKINSKFFDRFSAEYNNSHPDANIDLYRQILETSPDVLATPPAVVTRNIKLASLYGIDLIDEDHYIKAPTVLTSRIFIHLVDILIENSDEKNDFYNYLCTYMSVLKEEKTIKKILYKLYTGSEDFIINPNTNQLRGIRSEVDPPDLDEVVSHHNIEKLTSNIPNSLKEYIDEHEYEVDSFVQDDYINRLDNDPNVGQVNHAYVINNVRVSILKFKRIWTLIMSSGLTNNIDKKELFMLALTYNSYYRDADLEILQQYVNSLGLKG